uniref:Uncharacterized protein n=1 Tax=Anopheles minimus TaxID=112268 RepID=A0A182WMN5_9DIPT
MTVPCRKNSLWRRFETTFHVSRTTVAREIQGFHFSFMRLYNAL